MLSRRWFVALVTFIGFAAGMASGAEATRLRVLTSIPPLYCWTVNVAGSLATVENLLPADVSPHDYQFRPRDLKRIGSADVIVLNGLGLEDWFARAIRANSKDAKKKVVRVADGLPEAVLVRHLPTIDVGAGKGAAHDHDHDHAGEQANPHLWLDPQIARHGVSNILHALQAADPANAAGYATNATVYLAKLDALDAEIRTATATIRGRPVVTFHDAFPYFCRRYGLDLVGVIEEVPGTDPSPRYLAALLKVVRAKGVKVLFTEPSSNPRLAKRLADDLGIAVAELDVLETGALTPTSYEEGMRRNLAVLRQALK